MTGILVFILITLVVILLVKQLSNASEIAEMQRRLDRMERQLHRIDTSPSPAARRPESTATRDVRPPVHPGLASMYPPPSAPPPLPVVPSVELPGQRVPSWGPPFSPVSPAPQATQSPPVVPPPLPREPIAAAQAKIPNPEPAAAAKPRTPDWLSASWENFLGVKLFAWIGGLALFLGVAFFVKWSFDRDLITPLMRVVMGAVTGLGLIVLGLRMPRARYMVTVQTLCATGIVVLYADSFAAHAYYHFIGATSAFALMAFITVGAFFMAVRLDAQVIAVLGLLGGFLTPPLLATGEDHAVGLFGYLALLDAGLIAVALRKRWTYLVPLAAVATGVTQWVWVFHFFAPEKMATALTVFLGFAVLFVGALAAAERRGRLDKWVGAAGVLMPCLAMLFAMYLLGQGNPQVTSRVWLLFGFVFAIDLLYLGMAWLREEMRAAHLVAGGGVFVLLLRWTMEFLTPALLGPALVLYLVFTVLHSIFPLTLHRAKKSSLSVGWAHLAPPMALVLIIVPLFRLAESSFLLWPVVLLIDVLAIFIAMLTASLVAILAVFTLTVLATALWIFQLPPSVAEVPGMLVVIGGFAIFFMSAALVAARKFFIPNSSTEQGADGTSPLPRVIFDQLTSMASVLPFLLLSLVVLRLPLANPAPVFGVAALLVVMLLGTARLLAIEWLPLVALGSVAVVEWTWHFERFVPGQPSGAIAWYLGFSALVLVFPFLFRTRFITKTGPWVAAALALPVHFPIVYQAIKMSAPDFAYRGLIPMAFAVPCFIAMRMLIQPRPVEGRVRLGQVALFGGATLLFVTLIFPIQFERQWITIGWALEGMALLWLFRRVPHPGLLLVGVGLLIAGFSRLALNPWVFTAYGRTGTPILNWYLYAYGIVAACQVAGAWLLARRRAAALGEPEDGKLSSRRAVVQIGEVRVIPLLCTLGTLLAFMLLNIEIADYFSARGGPLVFHLSASFEQDMTYSLAWAVFAFVLLAVGFVARNAATRYAGMALLGATLLKLFLHDLWRLGGLPRIGSLVGLAIVLLVVSLIYQRFLATNSGNKEKPTT